MIRLLITWGFVIFVLCGIFIYICGVIAKKKNLSLWFCFFWIIASDRRRRGCVDTSQFTRLAKSAGFVLTRGKKNVLRAALPFMSNIRFSVKDGNKCKYLTYGRVGRQATVLDSRRRFRKRVTVR